MVKTKVIQEELEPRRFIERAKDILMTRRGLSGVDAYRWISKTKYGRAQIHEGNFRSSYIDGRDVSHTYFRTVNSYNIRPCAQKLLTGVGLCILNKIYAVSELQRGASETTTPMSN